MQWWNLSLSPKVDITVTLQLTSAPVLTSLEIIARQLNSLPFTPVVNKRQKLQVLGKCTPLVPIFSCMAIVKEGFVTGLLCAD
jgi:hypothetical protein